jgi:hypothetical protein
MKESMTIDERLEFLLQSTESLHVSVQELHGVAAEHTKQIQQMLEKARLDNERFDWLARLATAHEQRPDRLEGGQ